MRRLPTKTHKLQRPEAHTLRPAPTMSEELKRKHAELWRLVVKERDE